MGFLWFRIIEKYHSMEFSARRERPSAKPPPLLNSERLFVDYIPLTDRKTNPPYMVVYYLLHKDRQLRGKENSISKNSPSVQKKWHIVTCVTAMHSRGPPHVRRVIERAEARTDIPAPPPSVAKNGANCGNTGWAE
ncbi:hypothetical protein TNCV_903821 [Trichonephila clavipes]|nr:hypothetical protein TNCV_903821 [Trichonephila clavipes]